MKVVSLFSGCGGLDLGFIQAGHEIIWANDIDSDAVKTYRFNIGSHIIEGDLKDIPSSKIPYGDIVIGGFPCQGFSMANKYRVIDDERNSLYREFYRVIRDKQPRYFVAENVRGILSLGKGEVIAQIVQDFESAGYRVKYKLFNLADYGVPQIRQRVILLGVRSDIKEDVPFPVPEYSKTGEGNMKTWVTIGEALKDIPEPTEDCNIYNHVYSEYKVTNRNFTGHRLTDPNKPSPTILARGNGGGGVVVIQHPNNHRRMSIRETAIIQTFPMDFVFNGSKTSCYRQVGNAVPPLFACLLAENFNNEIGDESK
ncbi:DNA cytosine methyltransferase [Bacillus altitudinis]|uniref:DNA cytosine methyltransferase n=1 Tax=Bacillus altitudinis TaxID=293387 RepID=UPI0037EC3DBD|nr:DNA cytosine methyltransferase [Bacillus altitudinis]